MRPKHYILDLIHISCNSIRNGCNWNGPRSHLGPWLFWSPRKLVPVWKCLNVSCGDQISWGPKVRGPNDIGDHFSTYSFKKWPQGSKLNQMPGFLTICSCLRPIYSKLLWPIGREKQAWISFFYFFLKSHLN